MPERTMEPSAAGQPAPTEAELLQAEINRFDGLQSDILLTRVNSDMEGIDSAVNALTANIANIRSRGYVFKNFLERKADTLATQWRDLRPQIQTGIQQQSQALRWDADQVQASLSRGQRATIALSALESKISAAHSNLEGMYSALKGNIQQTQQQIDDVVWTLVQVEQASFGFLPTEGAVEAVAANWSKPGSKDGMGGVLYLTDQRLIFEQKEEIATKKVLFITTAKQKVQALGWELPVANIASAVGSHRGFMNKDDFLTVTATDAGGLRTADGASYHTTDIHLKGETGEAWQGFIGHVKSGDIAKERTVPVDEKAAATVASAPTKCGTCGATITQTILRGQSEISCQYCGSVIRLG